MRKIAVAGTVLVLAGVALHVEQRGHEDARVTLTTTAEAATAQFRPAPIRPDWIIAGAPVTEAAEIAHTHDGAAQLFLWRTTAATFRWIHEADEIVTILDGAVHVTDADGQTRHLKAGDVALFPSGSVQTWYVPEHVTKSAILKRRMPTAVETAMRWLRRARGAVASVLPALG